MKVRSQCFNEPVPILLQQVSKVYELVSAIFEILSLPRRKSLDEVLSYLRHLKWLPPVQIEDQ